MNKNKIILYVEDDSNTLKVYSDFFKRRVGTVISAKNGQDAFQKFMIHKPHLIITDIKMPNSNGIELINKIRKVDAIVPIIILSAYAGEDYVLESIKDKINANLTKPVNNKELSILIEELLHSNKSDINKESNSSDSKKEIISDNRNGELSIVGIGSSAGGLEALTLFVSNLPLLNNTAYIIAQHLSPTYKTMLVDLLSRETKLFVKDACNGEKVEENVIYITPPNSNIELNENDEIVLTVAEKHSFFPKPSVNQLFISLAKYKKTNSVGIILSGTGSDGAQGMRAINSEGGITIVQDPKSAKYDGMPISAINGASVDIITEASKMGEELVALSNFPREKVLKKYQSSQSKDEMTIIFDLLYQYKKIDFSMYKSTTIGRRVERRMVSRKATSLTAYIDILKDDKNEIKNLFNDLLIGVTSFFRDEESYEAFKIAVEEYIEDNKTLKELRIWLPGSSTGEEAYSIAMTISEIIEEQGLDLKIRLFATDIDENALKDARRGRYSSTSLPNMDEERIKKFFIIKDNEFEIKRELRENIVFSFHNILTDPPFKDLDIVVCRNLLIYFTLNAQKYVMPMFHYALRKGGILFLGRSENVTNYEHLFATINKENKIFKYITSSKIDYNVSNIKLPTYNTADINYKKESKINIKTPLHELIKEEATKILLPNIIITNEQMEVIYKKGSVDYIEIPEGYVTYNLFKMVDPRLSIDLRAAVNATNKNNAHVSTAYTVIPSKEEKARFISSHVIRIEDGRDLVYLFYFNEINAHELPQFKLSNNFETFTNNEILSLELKRTKEHMQTLVEELETSNEELQSTNEELQSSNEELQSTNEELETTNEELQSTNEELQTAYSELKEMYSINNESKNEFISLSKRYEKLFDVMNDGVIVSTMDGVILRTNTSMQMIIGENEDALITKTWKDISYYYNAELEKKNYNQLLKDSYFGPYKRVVVTKNNNKKTLRIQDYLLEDDRGLIQVWSFATDITQEELIKHDLQLGEEKYKATFEYSSLGIAHVSMSDNFLNVNNKFSQILGYKEKDFKKMTLSDIFLENNSKEEATLRKRLLEGNIDNYQVEVQYKRKNEEIIWVNLSVSKVKDNDNEECYFIYIIDDITKQKTIYNNILQAETVFNSTQESIVVTDSQRKVLRVNSSFENMTGYSLNEVIGKDINILKSGEHPEIFYNEINTSLAKVGSWAGEIINKNKKGDLYPALLNINAVENDKGEVFQYVGVLSDVSLLKNSQDKINYLAKHDVLTGLVNKSTLVDRLSLAIEKSKRSNKYIALFFIDLDRFKIVNDGLGHDIGDQVLKAVALKFTSLFRKEDTIARIGGDEFVIFVENLSNPIEATRLAQSIIDTVSKEMYIDEHKISVGASVGVSIYPNDAVTYENLIRQADIAMYEAKKAGRNTFMFTSNELSENAFEKVTLENAIRDGLQKNEFKLVYQPIVDVNNIKIVHLEALIRWEHSSLGTVTPTKFIPIAEESDLITLITEFVVFETIKTLKEISQKSKIKISINYSFRDLQSNSLFKKFEAYLEKSKVDASFIIIELTERKLMLDKSGEHKKWMQRYRELGVEFSLDDFGTGYSNLSYLSELPLSTVKIDKSFITNIKKDNKSKELVKATIAMTKALKYKVIAEGVESKEEFDFLKENDCDFIQGYYFKIPSDMTELQNDISNNNSLIPANYK